MTHEFHSVKIDELQPSPTRTSSLSSPYLWLLSIIGMIVSSYRARLRHERFEKNF